MEEVMRPKASKPKAFRPTAENQRRLEYAEKLGIGVSDVVNDLLAKHLKDYLENRALQLRKALDAPVP